MAIVAVAYASDVGVCKDTPKPKVTTLTNGQPDGQCHDIIGLCSVKTCIKMGRKIKTNN